MNSRGNGRLNKEAMGNLFLKGYRLGFYDNFMEINSKLTTRYNLMD